MAFTTPDPIELAWAAGFVDGEGCFTAGAGRWPQIIVVQVDRRPLERLHAALGGLGAVAARPPSTRSPNDKPQFEWHVRDFEGVQQALILLWPYMCEPKREQATRMVLKVRSNCRRIGKSHPHQKLSAERVKALRAAIAREDRSQAAIAAEFGVSQTLVSQIKLGKSRVKVGL